MSTIFLDADWGNLNGPQRVGTARVSPVRGHESVSFLYDTDWLANHAWLLLDPDLIHTDGWQYPKQSRFPGILHDSAPDRWGRLLMRRHEAAQARKEGRSARDLSETDFLLGVSDGTRCGGLRFRAEKNGPHLAAPTDRDVPPLTSLRKLEFVAHRIDSDEEWNDEMEMLLAPGSSLGGARPKATVAAPDGSLWIAKFPSGRDEVDVGAWEALTHDLARQCGIFTTTSRAEKYSREGHTFLIRRFDREGTSRVHYASAMCLLGGKDGDGAASGIGYLDLADLIMRASAAPDDDLRELWQRIVFGILVRNTDDHLRNHGFLLFADGWRLSPIFDVNPSPWGVALSLNITENNNSLDLALALEVAEHFRIPRRSAEAFAKKSRKVLAGWRDLAAARGLPRSQIALMGKAFQAV